MKNSMLKSIVALSVALFGIVAPINTAYAEDTVQRIACDQVGQTWYTATINNSNYFMGVGTIFRAGPGGSIQSSIEGSKTVSVQSSVAGSIGVDNIVKASIEAGASTAVSSSTRQTYTFSHDISPNRYGNMQFGNYGWKVTVKKYKIVPPCNTTVVVSGTAEVPSRDYWGYKYWES